MSNITIELANTSLPALIDRVDRGEEVTIARNGQAVARLISIDSADEQSMLATQHEEINIDQNVTTAAVDDAGFQALCSTFAAAV